MIVQDSKTYNVPDTDEFSGAFREADDLDQIAYDLIESNDELRHLSHYEIKCLWKEKGGKSKGAPVFGKVQKVSGILSHFTDADAIIWLAADHLHEYGFSEYQVQACLYHQLMQLDEDEDSHGDMNLKLISPDVSTFSNELSRYGAWWPHPEKFNSALSQLSLFDETEEKE